MSGENFDAMEIAFARIAKSTFPRELVFQRLPRGSEDTTDDRGFPKQGDSAYTDIDLSNPIPCQFIVQLGKELVLSGQQRSVTPYKITIPVLYDIGKGELARVDFSTEYRVHILAKGTRPESFLQIYNGGDAPGPDLTFIAYLTENTV